MLKQKFFILVLTLLMISCNICFAYEINLSNESVLVDGVEFSGDSIKGLSLESKMDHGASDSEALKENIEIDKIIKITKAGEYVFSGSLSDGQIAVDANKIDGEVKLILNNVNIECEDAPAIFIYSKDIENDKCKVVISPAKDTENLIKGGKIKVDVQGWKSQDDILYYVEKNYDDEGTYYERYKYDGAISSDISLTFDGEGTLNVIGAKKEGIEGKMHLNFENGTYIIKSMDDSINAAADGKSIITINDGTVIAYLLEEAKEGDGIDSNGYIYINGGKVYTFPCTGADNGLDSDRGTHINGGEVLSMGTMNDKLNISDEIGYARASFGQGANSGEVICVADENNNILFAMDVTKRLTNFFYTSDELEKNKEYVVYTDVEVKGNTDEWNIYTNIESANLFNATKNEFNEMQRPNFIGDYEEQNGNKKVIAIVFLVLAVILLIIMLVIDMKDENTDAKVKIINLLIGILIGILLATGISVLSSAGKNIEDDFRNNMMREFENMNGRLDKNMFPNMSGDMRRPMQAGKNGNMI